MNKDIELQRSEETTYQRRLFSFMFSKNVPPISTEEERITYPENNVNVVSRLMFYWMNPLLVKGYKRTLNFEDTFKIDEAQSTQVMYSVFRNHIEIQRKKNKSEEITTFMILKAIYFTMVWDIWISLGLKVVSDVSSSMSPLLLKKLVNFVEFHLDDNLSRGPGVGYAIGCALLVSFMSIVLNYSFYRAALIGCKVRTILTRAMLEKSFEIDAIGSHEYSSSKINSIMATDLARIDNGFFVSNLAITFPVPLIISIVLLIINLGVSALAGLACVILMFVVLGASFKKLVAMREKITVYVDIRVKQTEEFLKYFRMVKFYNWESVYEKNIRDAREKEVKYTLQMQTVKNILMSVSLALPNISALVAFITVSKVSPNKNAADIFASLSIFQALSVSLFQFPMGIAAIANIKVGMKRVSGFLSCENDLNIFEENDGMINDDTAIKVTNATFEWPDFDKLKHTEIDDKMTKVSKHATIEKQVITDDKTEQSSSESTDVSLKKNKNSSLKNINFELKKVSLLL